MITLILKECQFIVDKQKLIDKSQYFATLLSKNYIDYRKRKHTILYDIPIMLMEMFLDWIHYDYLPAREQENITSNPEELNNLFDLLEISVLFAADKLIEDITDIFEQRYMKPEYLLDIWLYAAELGIQILRDLFFSASLDRFVELSLDSLRKLQKKDFLKLICNINLRCSDRYLNEIINDWVQINLDDTIYDERKFLSGNKEKPTLQAIIMSNNSDINSDFFIYCWDGKEFFKFTSFKYPKDIIKYCNYTQSTLKGERIVARGYDLYLLGGQYIHNRRYNKNIWRYSLISKKWYLQTVMPIGRRDMVAAFVQNKLIIIAGIGKDRKKVNRIDIYDVHADTWIEDKFSHIWKTDTKHFAVNGNLYIFDKNDTDSYISIYSSELGYWQYLNFSEICPFSLFIYKFDIPKKAPILTFDNARCHLDCSHIDFKYVPMDDMNSLYKSSHEHESRLHMPYAIKLFKIPNNGEYIKETINLPIIACCKRQFDSCNSIDYSNLHLHCIPCNLPSLHCRSKFINLMDLKHLHHY
ncbi:hypothetical protein P5V15_008916 [Pogonomyrmex californicus]